MLPPASVNVWPSVSMTDFIFTIALELCVFFNLNVSFTSPPATTFDGFAVNEPIINFGADLLLAPA